MLAGYADIAAEGAKSGFATALFSNFAFDLCPLTKGGRVLSLRQLQAVLVEFSFFSRELPLILARAYQGLGPAAPAELRNEILLNLAEELGYVEPINGKFGFSHYDLLKSEILNIFDIDAAKERVTDDTEVFFESIYALLGGSPATAFGTLAALEISAVPEIRLVKELCVRALAAERLAPSVAFMTFLDAHISSFEINHSLRLLNAAPEVIHSEEDARSAQEAYQAAAGALIAWWSQHR